MTHPFYNLENDPFILDLQAEKELFWTNRHHRPGHPVPVPDDTMQDAALRLKRFAPYLEKVFPELSATNGVINSSLKEVSTWKNKNKIPGQVLLKMDQDLPVSGSIKARGGIYEVLKHAETLAFEHKLLTIDSDYSILKDHKEFYKQHSISVGSTGNLGLSIGLMGSTLGFSVHVHMSKDARQWKKDLLRESGVQVYEYENDYSFAVESARKLSQSNPKDHFIDDENSLDLFIGYSTAAFEIQKQLAEQNIRVSQESPLFVYLPCGVGGGPGGIAYGLKKVFGDHAHCFFAEPVQSPSVLLGFYTGLHEKISVNDIGLNNKTIADGLAVGRPSGLVGKLLHHVIDGFYTVSDHYLSKQVKEMYQLEGTFLEPSAVAGCKGPDMVLNQSDYCSVKQIQPESITHLIWGTGGSLVPEDIKKEHLHQ